MNLKWFKENRLKLVSGLAVLGDFLLGMAGGASFFFWGHAHGAAGMLLIFGGAFGLLGHGVVVIWGKGGKGKSIKTESHSPNSSPLRRALMPQHYPLDWAFLNFVISGALYIAAGIVMPDISFAMFGVFAGIGSLIGWLWPQNKPVFGYDAIKITAMIYALSSVSIFISTLTTQNVFIGLATCAFIASNAILYTVRKANQSAFTQGQNG